MSTEASLKIGVDSTEVKNAGKALDDLAKTGAGAEKATKGLGDEARKAAESSKTMATGFSGAAGQIKNLIGAYVGFQAVKTALVSTITVTAQFEKSISELSAITGATGKDLEYYAAQAKEIGRTTTLSASQAATAFKLIASAKPDLLENAEALNAVTRSAVTLAEAAGIDLPEAATALGNSLNQFQADASEATRFINVLAAGAKFGSSSIADTTLALKNSGAAANAAGLSFESTNAAIQALATGGIKAAEAGTGLRNILLILESETDQNTKPSVVGLSTAIENLAAKQLNLTELTDIFGRESAIAAQTIINQAGSLGELEKKLTDTSTAYEQAAINTANLDGDTKAAKSAIEALQIALGEKLTPSLRDATQGFTGITSSIAEFVSTDDFSEWMGVAAKGAEALGVVLGVRLVASVGSSAASFVAATARSVAYQAALARQTGASASAAVAATALGTATTAANKAIAFMGGPVGIIAAAAGLLYFVTAAGRAKVSIEDYSASIGLAKAELDRLNGSGKKVTQETLVAMQHVIEAVNGELAAANEIYGKNSKQVAALSAELMIARNNLSKASTAFSELTTETEENTGATGESADAVDDHNAMLGDYARAQDAARDATEKAKAEQVKNAEAIRDTIVALEVEQAALGMTDRAAVIFKATIEATSKDALPEQIAKIAELAAENYDLGEAATAAATATETARKAETKAAEDSAKAVKEAAETAAADAKRAWEATHDYLSGAFVDLMNNGGNAFDNIAKAFARTVQRMVAEWAASGLMELLSGGGLGGFSLGSLIGPAATGISSVLSGGAAAASTTAAAGAGTGIGATISGGLSSAGSALAAIPGWGWALGGAAIAAKLLDSGGTMSSNAGILTQDVAGAAGSTFDLATFDSGADFTGFARREDQADAIQVADTFRAYDSVLTQIAKSAGVDVNISASDFVGTSETGSGTGAFFGTAAEEGGTDGTPLSQQLDSYVSQWVDIVGRTNGIDQSIIDDIQSQGSADAMIAYASEQFGVADGSNANGIDYVPFDGYRSILHRGEKVTSVAERDRDSVSNDRMASEISILRREVKEQTVYNRRTFEILDRWAASNFTVVV